MHSLLITLNENNNPGSMIATAVTINFGASRKERDVKRILVLKEEVRPTVPFHYTRETTGAERCPLACRIPASLPSGGYYRLAFSLTKSPGIKDSAFTK